MVRTEESKPYRIIQNNQDVIVNHDETEYLSQTVFFLMFAI